MIVFILLDSNGAATRFLSNCSLASATRYKEPVMQMRSSSAFRLNALASASQMFGEITEINPGSNAVSRLIISPGAIARGLSVLVAISILVTVLKDGHIASKCLSTLTPSISMHLRPGKTDCIV